MGVESILKEVAARQLQAELRADRADRRMDRADERAEERAARAEQRMDKLEAKLNKTADLVRMGIKLVIKTQGEIKEMKQAQIRTDQRFNRWMDQLGAKNGNGRH
jgi:hypothetical protein